MSEAAKVVKSMLDAVLAEDLASALAVIDDDVTTIEPETLQYGGIHQGLAAFRDNVLGAILSKMSMAIGAPKMLPLEDKVAVSMMITFTSRKTGASINMPYVEIYTVRSGKICKIDVYPQDTAKLSRFWAEN